MNRVANLGKFAVKQDLSERFWGKVAKSRATDCWLWTERLSRSGYGVLTVDGKARRAHRVAWELTFGPIPEGLCVCHACDTPRCCNPKHLLLGTSEANTMDKVKKNRQARGADLKPETKAKGDQHGMSKLTSAQVSEIRSSYRPGENSYATLAKQYAVTKGTIAHIITNRNWRSPHGEIN